MPSLDQLLIGAAAPLGPRGLPSAIDKREVSTRLLVSRAGLEGDVQGDRRRHGGLDKALHHYAYDHYGQWVVEIGARAVLEQPGAFGENLSTRGMTETSIAIGDVFRLGGAVLQVSQGRQPCWKLNVRFEHAEMAATVQRLGLTGWYYRVLEEGYIAAGDEFYLLERASPEWTLERAWRLLYVDTMNPGELREMASLQHLSEGWRKTAGRRLETGFVEDWKPRLEGHS